MKKIKNLLFATICAGGISVPSFAQYFTPGQGSSIKIDRDSRGRIMTQQYNLDYRQGDKSSGFDNFLLKQSINLSINYLVHKLSQHPRRYYIDSPQKQNNAQLNLQSISGHTKDWFKNVIPGGQQAMEMDVILQNGFKFWFEKENKKSEEYFGKGSDKLHKTAKILSYEFGKAIPGGTQMMELDKKAKYWWQY